MYESSLRRTLETRHIGYSEKRVQLPFDFKTLDTERNVTDLIIPETM